MSQIVSRHRLQNLLRSGLLLLAMGAVLALVGWLWAGGVGVLWTLALAALLAVLTPSVAPERLMRAQGARPLHPLEAPELHRAVQGLSERAGIEPPRLYLVPMPVPQAFATTSHGRAALGVSPSLLRGLSPREVIAVVAHELSHLRHRDLWVMRLAETVRRTTRTLSFFGLLLLFFNLPLMLLAGVHVPWLAVLVLVVAPWAVGMLSLALSRAREHDADAGAVALTGEPRALASALAKIEAASRGPWWMRLFSVDVPESLRTHPSTAERIARLHEMARGAAPKPPRRPRPPRGGSTRAVRPIWIRGPHPRRPGSTRRYVVG
ncbi:MAG TPA: zinc metalloprotease HtpX [Sandaracinaceae bacterium LLY-WYZ-13_1]|nr:zinc metalloprotease HtpX [Sandaracinaceae bacterium LLY-WYZ-13_1]